MDATYTPVFAQSEIIYDFFFWEFLCFVAFPKNKVLNSVSNSRVKVSTIRMKLNFLRIFCSLCAVCLQCRFVVVSLWISCDWKILTGKLWAISHCRMFHVECFFNVFKDLTRRIRSEDAKLRYPIPALWWNKEEASSGGSRIFLWNEKSDDEAMAGRRWNVKYFYDLLHLHAVH